MKKCKRLSALLLCLLTVLTPVLPAGASEIPYLPDVTEEMTDYGFWADLQKDADNVILTPDEIIAYNQDIIDASGTMVMDLKDYPDTFDGIARNEAIKKSSTADAEYYYP